MPWKPIETAQLVPGARIIATDGDRVGEAVAWRKDDDTGLEWRWACDGCSECWTPPMIPLIEWQDMPRRDGRA